jgi:hypothetical protein
VVTPDEGYAVLEIPPGSSISEVKQAYRELAKAWHPDLYPYDDALRARCEREMQRINQAYELLRRDAPRESVGQAESARNEARRKRHPRTAPETDKEEPAWDGSIRVREPGTPPPADPLWRPFRRHVSTAEADFGGLFQTLAAFTAASIAMLSLFVIDNPTSRDYYLIMRVVVTASSLYGAYFAASRGYWESAVALFLLGVFLNPVVPIAMSVSDWKLFNASCPVLLLFFWFHMYDRECSRE